MTDTKSDWGFSVRNFDDHETQQFLRGILIQDSCVPFLGAGFTRGEKARHKAVPGGGRMDGDNATTNKKVPCHRKAIR
ncbi:hypothetical protein ACKUDT_25260 [Klebsiella pneumoniae]|uniref:hypothetical protein n=1 Tax=Klebsiella pneumoniae TaxID=573 RepID=UPI0014386965|nr:hypothetical protein [Klebsiella pneumoniae]EKZ9667663.1 hypothetical protein [Klebsiella pneumoniae]ELA0001316.1 hypothetical protein [Klebsiella pneumoniae]ELA2981899.1 hypothetical protein [Klebsiella pneumoniae]WRS16601.1 hypothetical protein VLW27_15835 [Klebsiella pneumoniae]HBW3947923.1 hypothetical protein [Klebsiella pneumoniae]